MENFVPLMLLYIDPGAGALIWQGILAGVFGALYYWKRIVVWFRTKIDRKDARDSSKGS